MIKPQVMTVSTMHKNHTNLKNGFKLVHCEIGSMCNDYTTPHSPHTTPAVPRPHPQSPDHTHSLQTTPHSPQTTPHSLQTTPHSLQTTPTVPRPHPQSQDRTIYTPTIVLSGILSSARTQILLTNLRERYMRVTLSMFRTAIRKTLLASSLCSASSVCGV